MKNLIAIIALLAVIGLAYHVVSENDTTVDEGAATEKVEFEPQTIEEVEENEEEEIDDIETLEAEVDADIEELENLDF